MTIDYEFNCAYLNTASFSKGIIKDKQVWPLQGNKGFELNKTIHDQWEDVHSIAKRGC